MEVEAGRACPTADGFSHGREGAEQNSHSGCGPRVECCGL
jgi:hypothetical protein